MVNKYHNRPMTMKEQRISRRENEERGIINIVSTPSQTQAVDNMKIDKFKKKIRGNSKKGEW